MIEREAIARATVGHCRVWKWSPSTLTFSMNSAGTFSTVSPKKSLIWVLKISTAMPEVKPIVTG